MNIFGFRPFKGRFNLGNSDDIPTNTDGTLIGAVKQINSDLSGKTSWTKIAETACSNTVSINTSTYSEFYILVTDNDTRYADAHVLSAQLNSTDKLWYMGGGGFPGVSAGYGVAMLINKTRISVSSVGVNGGSPTLASCTIKVYAKK